MSYYVTAALNIGLNCICMGLMDKAFELLEECYKLASIELDQN